MDKLNVNCKFHSEVEDELAVDGNCGLFSVGSCDVLITYKVSVCKFDLIILFQGVLILIILLLLVSLIIFYFYFYYNV